MPNPTTASSRSRAARAACLGALLLLAFWATPAAIAQSETDYGSGGSRIGRESTRSRGESVLESSRRREDRRSRREEASKGTTRGEDGSTIAGGAAPRGLEQRSRVSTIRGAPSSSIQSRAPRTNIVFNYRINERQPVLMFDPPDLQMEEGETVSANLVLHNPTSTAATDLRLGLLYNPDVLRLVKLDVQPLRQYLADAPDIRYDPLEGRITLAFRFNGPVKFGAKPLLRFDWKAVTPTPFAQVEIIDVPDEARGRPWPSGMYDGARSILGQRRIREDGIIPLGYSIDAVGGGEANARSGDGGATEGLTLDEQVRLMNDPVVFGRGARGGIELELEPESREVAMGEEFDVPIVFYNPRQSQLDSMRIAVLFDPRVLQVVDTDDGNAITLGTNILEGDRRSFPFDYHIDNTADNERGRLLYRMGIGGEAALPGEAVLATVRFKAIRRIRGGTAIRFQLPDETEAGTKLTFLGRDVLGDAESNQDGLYDTSVTVR